MLGLSLFSRLKPFCLLPLLLSWTALSSNVEGSLFEKGLHFVIVDKTTLSAKLFKKSPQGDQIVKEYKVVIGRKQGDKETQGDLRTPEGIYITGEHIPTDDLPNRYGAHAIPLNYPNPIDRINRKTGSGIWLHGVESDERVLKEFDTEGCVAFRNEDILELREYLKPAVVLIFDNWDGYEGLNSENPRIEKLSHAWLNSWRQQDLRSYISFYDPFFVSQTGQDILSYAQHKKGVFRAYKKIQIETSPIFVFAHPKYWVSLFEQDFKGDDRFHVRGLKALYWDRSAQDIEPRIFAEDFKKVDSIDQFQFRPMLARDGVD